MKNSKLIALNQPEVGRRDELRRMIAGKVLEILRESHLSREETRALFGAVMPEVSGKKIDRAAERIIGLFIKEQLTIEEGKNVLQEVTDQLDGGIDIEAPQA